jgi:hypothetical protein
MIDFCIAHLDLDSFNSLDFRPRWAVAVSQQQLQGTQLEIDTHVAEFSITRGDVPESINQLMLVQLTAGQFRDLSFGPRTASWIPALTFSPSRHGSSS